MSLRIHAILDDHYVQNNDLYVHNGYPILIIFYCNNHVYEIIQYIWCVACAPFT